MSEKGYIGDFMVCKGKQWVSESYLTHKIQELISEFVNEKKNVIEELKMAVGNPNIHPIDLILRWEKNLEKWEEKLK